MLFNFQKLIMFNPSFCKTIAHFISQQQEKLTFDNKVN